MVYVSMGTRSGGACDGRKRNNVREICNQLGSSKHYMKTRGRTLPFTTTTLPVTLTKNWEVYGGLMRNGKLSTDYSVTIPGGNGLQGTFQLVRHAFCGTYG